ncbi:hypothetical protein Nos7524_4009 [Nostoc sp. PCC 7524]|uniref:DUF4350 domain-containing protein n=1 Tax=Nostoc sp. (strain ATCC 29411 / PCC 7524) TaxID=28072 RepID=UPI00029F27E5|nr:DUF4350 domain-containing protein [Nostoc sp. PCC 7524]AFY49781.1 hypothetical protein Nos7524_4009 [Nostoc sp. PCC 7524]
MKRSKRTVWLGAIAIVVLAIFSFIAAPTTQIYTGSTYSRAADGYGAWYAYMQQQGTNIQRWQKPMSNLTAKAKPATLLRIYNYQREANLSPDEQEWLRKGNNLVILGVRTPVSPGNFHTVQKSPVGDVKIATRRRYQKAKQGEISLGDRFGAIVWQEKRPQGTVVFSTTPYLAANAYQDELNNFEYLASLVKQKDKQLFVDEYIHGYKDADVRESEGQGNLISYLANTPLLVALIQAGVLLLVLIWSQNRRFGKPIALETPVIDNSEAYIQALAGVLQKAESSDFVLEMVGKEEQIQLQKALGLEAVPLEHQVLLNLWTQKTGKSATELDAALKLQAIKRRVSQRDLISWLRKWRTVRES